MVNDKQKTSFASMFNGRQFKISRVPIDSRPQSTRWGGIRATGVRHDPPLFEIEEIIRSGDMAHIRVPDKEGQ